VKAKQRDRAKRLPLNAGTAARNGSVDRFLADRFLADRFTANRFSEMHAVFVKFPPLIQSNFLS
jgi:hypothetical protein